MPDFKIHKQLPIARPVQDTEARMREASKMYEKHFLGAMVKAMRQTVDHSKLTEPSMAEKIYSEQLDQEYVEKWGERGGIGLADIIHNQLQERFFNNGGPAQRPAGPIPVEKHMRIKIDEGAQPSIPLIRSSSLPKNDVSFLFEWDENKTVSDVVSPYAGKIAQSFRVGEDRQILKIEHPDGLFSTISFIGQTKDWARGQNVESGQKLGTLSPHAKGLTWQVERVELS